MKFNVSIAIETSCKLGQVALGKGDELVKAVSFDASARHATQLVLSLRQLHRDAELSPGDIRELYVSAGPGSFTGLRVGITVARTLAQLIPKLRCVGVPTALAVAQNAANLQWNNLAVVMDAREGCIYVQLFTRREGRVVPAGEAGVVKVEEFLSSAPSPLTIIGEGLAYHGLSACSESLEIPDSPDSPLHMPTAEGVWHAGRMLAKQGRFVDYHLLLPIYARRPEAVRLWEKRNRRD